MRIALIAVLTALPALAQEKPEKKEAEPVDVGKVLRGSKEFQEKCKKYRISFDFEDGIVRAVGEIAYRGGGPCEYLINVFPNKSHETIVLLDTGPWKEEKRRPRKEMAGLAMTLNNAFLAAGFRKGKPFDWDRKTGEVFPPKGETVHIYAEFKDEKGQIVRARMADWLWNYKTLFAMQPGKFVFTGSLMIDEGPPHHKKWFGAEMDGLLVAVLNTSTALIDNTEDGGLDNGAYEAIGARVPEIGTRVTVVYSKRPLKAKEYKALELPQEVLDERKRRDAEKKKPAATKDKDK